MPMAGPLAHLNSLRRPALALLAAAAIAFPLATQAQGRGPDKIADVAEAVIDAVVNTSTSQPVSAGGPSRPGPESKQGQIPPGSPFEEFFEEFFKNRRGGPGENSPNRSPRRVNSLGSGFIIDASGIVVTNNHVIADADEISVVLNDGTKLNAALIRKDTKTD